ncbi:hypothetical protein C6H66_08810 [Photorhabdus hindustanensis]|uniref:Uncharacterized protein n=1 Tax=Photorhabdus hindustanensis TaxID=2918802 RepID=A0A2S8Q3J2_9GAMM|nr:hypothetical protein C6H66_08810 [Photorhabdus hindustanensis]
MHLWICAKGALLNTLFTVKDVILNIFLKKSDWMRQLKKWTLILIPLIYFLPSLVLSLKIKYKKKEKRENQSIDLMKMGKFKLQAQNSSIKTTH